MGPCTAARVPPGSRPAMAAAAGRPGPGPRAQRPAGGLWPGSGPGAGGAHGPQRTAAAEQEAPLCVCLAVGAGHLAARKGCCGPRPCLRLEETPLGDWNVGPVLLSPGRLRDDPGAPGPHARRDRKPLVVQRGRASSLRPPRARCGLAGPRPGRGWHGSAGSPLPSGAATGSRADPPWGSATRPPRLGEAAEPPGPARGSGEAPGRSPRAVCGHSLLTRRAWASRTREPGFPCRAKMDKIEKMQVRAQQGERVPWTFPEMGQKCSR